MKKSIKLAALFLLLSASSFAVSASTKSNLDELENKISIKGSANEMGVEVMVNGTLDQNAIVRISDDQRNNLFAVKMSNQAGSVKAFNLSKLDNGNYTISVYVNNSEVTKTLHIYDEDGKKTFFIFQ
jgi:hypothetical protein